MRMSIGYLEPLVIFIIIIVFFLCRDCALPGHDFGAAFPSVNTVLI